MVFWIGILVGGAFAWFAIKLGFYQTWALVFNIIISIYLAIYLQPVIVNIAVVGDTLYSGVLSMAVIASTSFLILHGLSYTFLTGQFNVSFPKVFNVVGTSLLGFLAGFLVWSFLSLLIYMTPASQNTFVRGFGFTDQYQQASVSCISRFCNLVNVVASPKDNELSAEQTIDKLLNNAKSKTRGKTPKKPEPVKPVKKPDDVKTDTTDQNQPPPPDIGI